MVFFPLFALFVLFAEQLKEGEKLHDLWRSYDRLQQGRGS
jgi:hypothetical protein